MALAIIALAQPRLTRTETKIKASGVDIVLLATPPAFRPKQMRAAVEAGATRGWWRYAGRSGAVIGLDRFGESAPAPELFKHFGFTAEKVVQAVKSVI